MTSSNLFNPQAFRTYYCHGLISSNITDKRYSSHVPLWPRRVQNNDMLWHKLMSCLYLTESRQPFMLFGKHSSSEDLESYSFNFASESHQVRNTGPRGSAARHMVRKMSCTACVAGNSHCNTVNAQITVGSL